MAALAGQTFIQKLERACFKGEQLMSDIRSMEDTAAQSNRSAEERSADDVKGLCDDLATLAVHQKKMEDKRRELEGWGKRQEGYIRGIPHHSGPDPHVRALRQAYGEFMRATVFHGTAEEQVPFIPNSQDAGSPALVLPAGDGRDIMLEVLDILDNKTGPFTAAEVYQCAHATHTRWTGVVKERDASNKHVTTLEGVNGELRSQLEAERMKLDTCGAEVRKLRDLAATREGQIADDVKRMQDDHEVNLTSAVKMAREQTEKELHETMVSKVDFEEKADQVEHLTHDLRHIKAQLEDLQSAEALRNSTQERDAETARETEFNRLKTANLNQRLQLVDRDAELALEKRKVQSANSQMDGLQKNIDSLVKDIAVVRHEATHLRDTLADYLRKNDTISQQDAATLQDERDARRADKVRCEDQVRKLNDTTRELRGTIQDRDSTITRQSEAINVKGERITQLEADVERWKSKLAANGLSLEAASLKITQLTSSETSTMQQLTAAQQQLRAVEKSLEDCRAEHKTMQDNLTGVAQRLKDAEENLSSAGKTSAEKISDMTRSANLLQNFLEMTKMSLKTCEDAHKAMHTNLGTARADLKEAQDQLSEKGAELERITIEHADQVKVVADAKAELSARLDKTREDLEACDEQLTERTALHSTALDAIERLDAKYTRHEAVITRLSARLEVAGMDLAIRTQELDDCTEHRATAAATITGLQDEIESHDTAMADLTTDLDIARRLLNDSTDRLMTLRTESDATITRLEEDGDIELSTERGLREEAQENLAERTQQLAECRSKCEDTEKVLEEARAKVAEQARALADPTTLQTAQEKAERLQQELNTSQRSLVEAQDKIVAAQEKLVAAQQKVVRAQKKFDDSQQNLNNSAQRLHTARDDFNRRSNLAAGLHQIVDFLMFEAEEPDHTREDRIRNLALAFYRQGDLRVNALVELHPRALEWDLSMVNPLQPEDSAQGELVEELWRLSCTTSIDWDTVYTMIEHLMLFPHQANRIGPGNKLAILLASTSINLTTSVTNPLPTAARFKSALACITALRAIELQLRFVDRIDRTKMQELLGKIRAYIAPLLTKNELVQVIMDWMEDALQGIDTATPTTRLLSSKIPQWIHEDFIWGTRTPRRIARCEVYCVVLHPTDTTMLAYTRDEMHHVPGVRSTISFDSLRRVEPTRVDVVPAFRFRFNVDNHIWVTVAVKIPTNPLPIIGEPDKREPEETGESQQ